MLHIVKIGGKIIEDDFLLKIFLKKFQTFHGSKIIIHGGGLYASGLLKKLGVYAKIVEGRRITNTKTLEVLVLSYAGLLNKQVVACLQTLDGRAIAIGLSGVDGNIIYSFNRSVKIINYGHVGDFTKKSVNIKCIYSLIQLNYVPVLCSLNCDAKGNLLNTNADTVASYIAISMNEIEEISLHFCLEKKGVLKNIKNANSFLSKMNLSMSEKFRDGILLKINNAFYTLKKGLRKISILHPSSLLRAKNKTFLFL